MKLITQFQIVIHAGLVLALIITISGCQPTTARGNPSSSVPLLTPRPTVTPVMPMLTMPPITIVVTPTSTAAPEVADVGYPPDTRTGISHLDTIIDVVLANDLARVRDLTHYAKVGCTTAQGFGGPPKCRTGEVPGTLAEVVQVLGPEGFTLRRDDRSAGISPGDYRLIAVVSNVDESTQSEDWWLPAKYALVFYNAGSPWAVILLTDDKGIVRILHVESLDRVWQLVSGDFILPPSG